MDIKDVRLKKGMSIEEVNELISEWLLLEDDVYLGANYRHNWKCNCGNIIEGRMFRSIRGQQATDCGCIKYHKIEQRYKCEVEKTGEYEYIRSFRDGDILPNGGVVKRNIQIEIKHIYCGAIYIVDVGSFVNKGCRCTNCCEYKKSIAYHIEVELGEPLEKYWDFEKNNKHPRYINKYSHDDAFFKCISDDVNILNGLTMGSYHDSYKIKCYDFAGGKRCSSCHSKTIHTYDSFGYHNLDKVQSWHPDNEISPFNVSRSNGNKYKFICHKCGHIFTKALNNIVHDNQWCPKCSMSNGEKAIVRWLRYNDIDYEYEKEYDGLIGIGGKNLSYDFYLPEYNLLIEYQGEQHEKYKPGFHTSNNDFEKQQEHDRRKREYANKHVISILEIWYWDFDNIEEILNKEIIDNNKLI